MVKNTLTHTYSAFIADDYGKKEKEWYKLVAMIKTTEGVDRDSTVLTKNQFVYNDESGNRKNTVINLSSMIKTNPFLKGRHKSKISISNEDAFFNMFRLHITDQLFVSGKKSAASKDLINLLDRLQNEGKIRWNEYIPEELRIVFTGGE